MNDRQNKILNKEFKVNDHYSIRRSDYESMPDPMLAWKWSDECMKQLAANINANLIRYDADDPEGMDDDFWSTIEKEAVKMGMEYYEDFTDEYCALLEFEWNNL